MELCQTDPKTSEREGVNDGTMLVMVHHSLGSFAGKHTHTLGYDSISVGSFGCPFVIQQSSQSVQLLATSY